MPGAVVPIVPAAVVFDLGRGGDARVRPTADTGAAAYDDAHAGPVVQGSVGAGTGAVSGGLRGGVGSASAVLTEGSAAGTTVAALVVLNSAGAAADPATGAVYGARHGLPGEFTVGWLRPSPRRSGSWSCTRGT